MDVEFHYHGSQIPFHQGPDNWFNASLQKTINVPYSTTPPYDRPGWSYESAWFYLSQQVKWKTDYNYEAWPVISGTQIVSPWSATNNFFITGNVSLFANDHLIGRKGLVTNVGTGCTGYHPGSCVDSGTDRIDFGTHGNSNFIAAVNFADLPVVKAVFDLTLQGQIYDNKGTFYWADYGGDITLDLFVNPDAGWVSLTPLPLPGGMALLLPALLVLGFMACRRRRADNDAVA